MKMKDKKGKPAKAAEASKKSASLHADVKPEKAEPVFSRWALFEEAVLSKVKTPEKCKKVIAQRQSQVDDDSCEADLVGAHIRNKLRAKKQDPATCAIFFTTAEITDW